MWWTCGAQTKDFVNRRALSTVWSSLIALGFLLSFQTDVVADLRGHGGPVKSVTLSSDGYTALTGSFDYTVIYWAISSSGSKNHQATCRA